MCLGFQGSPRASDLQAACLTLAGLLLRMRLQRLGGPHQRTGCTGQPGALHGTPACARITEDDGTVEGEGHALAWPAQSREGWAACSAGTTNLRPMRTSHQRRGSATAEAWKSCSRALLHCPSPLVLANTQEEKHVLLPCVFVGGWVCASGGEYNRDEIMGSRRKCTQEAGATLPRWAAPVGCLPSTTIIMGTLGPCSCPC